MFWFKELYWLYQENDFDVDDFDDESEHNSDQGNEFDDAEDFNPNPVNSEMLRHAFLGHEEIVIPAVDHNNALLTARSVEFYVKIGDVNLWRGSTLFHAACLGGHLGLANTLADKGSDVHAVDHCNENALMYACMNGHRVVAAMLLDRGINLGARESGGYTALQSAGRA